jgi:hypothetical protein
VRALENHGLVDLGEAGSLLGRERQQADPLPKPGDLLGGAGISEEVAVAPGSASFRLRWTIVRGGHMASTDSADRWGGQPCCPVVVPLGCLFRNLVGALGLEPRTR